MLSVRLTISNISRLCAALFFAFVLVGASAQENSPFSRYGIGEYYTNQHIISRSMGGLTAAYADGTNNNVGQSVNFSNPATYGHFYMSTFDVAVTIDSRTLYSATPTGKFGSANFYPAYLALGVPLNRVKGWGIAFGLKPISRINYSVQSLQRIAGDSLQTLYEGSGGLNQAFVGIGKRWGTFSLGINTGYNFGRKEIDTRKTFINDTVSYYSSKSSTNTNFGGVFLSGGMQYDLLLSKHTNTTAKTTESYMLRFGFTGTLQQRMKATQSIDRQTYTVSASGDLKIDSVSTQSDIAGTVQLPATYAAGVTFHKTAANSRGVFELWSVGAEYTSTQWTKYRFYDQADKLADSWQFKFGLQFAPDPLASRGYWNNVNYRAGFYMGKDYIDADGKGLKTFGVSLGAGLPIRKWSSYNDQFTVMNLALQFGKRGSAANNVTENYMQLSLGISLSDIWFVKRRYD
ncbi:MAG: hypothetical protein JO301_16755 [Chitinophagaceae bacterium]|nr:hypothetical protein [Chitinophagaceae bacterium]